MIKYKVKDAANDLGVTNKKITEILEKHCGVSKKAAASLEESELDVIFVVITKENSVENFDAYFAARNKKFSEDEPRTQEPDNKTADKKSRWQKIGRQVKLI